MKWFGEPWGAPVNQTCARMEVPDGEVCPYCTRSIRPNDQGFEIPGLAYDGTVLVLDYHRACFYAELGIGPEPAGLDS